MINLNKIINLSLVSLFLSINPVLAQDFPENEESYLEKLNPSANPLIFPTQPEEVQINETTPITLIEALELGLQNNRELQITRLELERARSGLRESMAALFPTLDLSFDFSYTDSASLELQNLQAVARNSSAIDEDTSAYNFNGDIQLIYNIYNGGERGAQIRRSNQEIIFNQLQLERITEETRFNVTRDYYSLQTRDAQVAIAQAAVEDSNQSLRDARLTAEAGLGTRFDVLQAEVDVANASQALTRAIADQRIARRTLSDTLSLSQVVELTAADEITESGIWELSLEESIVLAYRNRAELEQQLVRREIGAADREIALSTRRPTLSAIASYDVLNRDIDDEFGVTDGYAFGLQLRWRLFDGGAAAARAEQANRDIDIAETEFAQTRNTVRLEVETAYYELIANQENIGTSQKAVETATERLRLARLRFQSWVGTQTEVIDAQRDLTEARGNFLQAIIGYNQSLNALQRSVSNLPDNRLFDASY